MGAVMDLTSRGLTQTIPSLGIAASQYQAMNRMDTASADMRASAAGNNQRLSVTPRLVPLPFAFEDYEFDITELEAVQRLGGTLDTAYTEEAQRSVAETFENWLVNGAAEFSDGGNTIYGYRTHPNRIAKSGASFATPDGIYTTILGMYNDMLALQPSWSLWPVSQCDPIWADARQGRRGHGVQLPRAYSAILSVDRLDQADVCHAGWPGDPRGTPAADGRSGDQDGPGECALGNHGWAGPARARHRLDRAAHQGGRGGSDGCCAL